MLLLLLLLLVMERLLHVVLMQLLLGGSRREVDRVGHFRRILCQGKMLNFNGWSNLIEEEIGYGLTVGRI